MNIKRASLACGGIGVVVRVGERLAGPASMGAVGGRDIPWIYEPGGINSRRFFDFAKFRKIPEEKTSLPFNGGKAMLDGILDQSRDALELEP